MMITEFIFQQECYWQKDNLLAHSWELTNEEFETLSKEEDELLSQPQYQKLTEIYLKKK